MVAAQTLGLKLEFETFNQCMVKIYTHLII